MLTQLKLAGVLDGVKALILGYFLGQDGEDLLPETEHILLDLIGDSSIPILSRFPHGHALPNLTIPHGLPVRLDTGTRSVTVLSEDKSAP
jgi:muramoyltetrapeptide carboxypeptidase